MNDNEIIKLAIQSAKKEFASGTLTDPGILHRDKLSPGGNDAQQYESDIGRWQSARFHDPKNCARLNVEWKK